MPEGERMDKADLKERLREALKRQCGLEEKDIENAIKKTKGIDLGIFVTEIKEGEQIA